MRRLVHALALLVTLVAGIVAPAAAAPRQPKTAAAAAPQPPRVTRVRPALWKIADKDTTIWLFGTIHALPAGVDWLKGPVAAAFTKSDQIVTEIPETDPSTMQAAVVASAVLPEGQSLRAMLGAEDRRRFETALTSFGLPVEAFDRFEPWYAAVALTALPLARSGYSAKNGVEERISAEAKRLGRPRIGLETAGYQLAMFDSLPREVQLRYLHEVLDGLPTLDQQLADIVREWSAGDPDRLAALLNAEEDDPVMVKVLLTDRNRAWTQWLMQRLDKPGTVFVAVGAGHLAGSDGVPALLKQSGVVAVRMQ